MFNSNTEHLLPIPFRISVKGESLNFLTFPIASSDHLIGFSTRREPIPQVFDVPGGVA